MFCYEHPVGLVNHGTLGRGTPVFAVVGLWVADDSVSFGVEMEVKVQISRFEIDDDHDVIETTRKLYA